jgi:AAA domain/PLD-like domain
MHRNSLSYARYWRNSLADSELGRGGFKKKDLASHLNLTPDEFSKGILDKKVTTFLFENEADDVEVIAIILRPHVYESKSDHGKRVSRLPEIVAPVVAKAVVDRNGRVYPSDYTVVPRDILEPLDRGSLSVGTVDDLDAWLTLNTHPVIDRITEKNSAQKSHADKWSAYVSYVDQLLKSVIGAWPDKAYPYLKSANGLFSRNTKSGGSSFHILGLYEHIQGSNPIAPLFDRFASEEELPVTACLAANAGFSLRLGHASDSYPLANAQRDALTHHLLSERGDILGVNGPPGTGKTTLLLSIVASHMVQSAISGENPKLIAAASTNNQAVTNIIDAFAKDFSKGSGQFAGRWLPDIRSFGSYFPAADKEISAATKYQTKSFFDEIETPEYFTKAKSAYLAAAQAAYPEIIAPTVKDVVTRLRADITSYAETLRTIEASWNALQAASDAAVALLGQDPRLGLADLQNQVANSTAKVEAAKLAKESLEIALGSEKWWMTLFSRIKAVAKRRFIAAKLSLKAASLMVPDECNTVDEIAAAFNAEIGRTQSELLIRQQALATGEAAIRIYETARMKWSIDISPVMAQKADGTFVTLADVDKKADTEIRFKAFLLATHYWEGRWLVEMEVLIPKIVQEKKGKGMGTIRPRWMRRMMITPCMVSTFYMLPSEMKISRYEAGDYVNDYLYEFIDLLIVDEAGQVLPEVAAASFALAKTALVIGDVMQIEPIWSVQQAVDIGNLLSNDLLDDQQIQRDYNRLCRLGKTSASGSVMLVAQWASRFHYDEAMPRGMFLYEHRRCYDEIIQFCNDLCYQGKLIPMRGIVHSTFQIPVLGYLHIDGKCIQQSGGSQQNQLEAEMIADWIWENKSRLEAQYQGTSHATIDQIVGVISPFGKQVDAITKACIAKGINAGKGEGELTIGTVHSLQGAERPIVIFSPTYSKHADGKFIDRNTSMLNVAVSRAKDSFLVFGDMDIFNPNDTASPRGLLAKYLFARPENALTFKSSARSDLVQRPEHFRWLLDAAAHDTFLLDVLAEAKKEVHIVSPWLRTRNMRDVGILTAMTKASARGVKINVYADMTLNQSDRENHWQMAHAALTNAGVKLFNIRRLHSKIVTKDDDIFCLGSFNWLSAARSGEYARHETSMIYSGPMVGNEILVSIESLLSRQ